MKYQHENPNIEIINKNLWAVRFSLIPLIPQISWKPDPKIFADKLPWLISPSGITILNKDFSLYLRCKQCYQTIMKLKPKQIKKELAEFSMISANNEPHQIYVRCLEDELIRRKLKGGDT